MQHLKTLKPKNCSLSLPPYIPKLHTPSHLDLRYSSVYSVLDRSSSTYNFMCTLSLISIKMLRTKKAESPWKKGSAPTQPHITTPSPQSSLQAPSFQICFFSMPMHGLMIVIA